LEENLFPSQLSVNSREDLEEERRLFYVAATRAAHKLTLSYAVSRYRWGNLISCEPSRFLDEINPEFIEETGFRKNKNSDFPFDQKPLERWDAKPLSTERSAAFKTHMKKVNSAEVQNFVGDDTSEIQTGMEVEHQRFGIGKVLLVEGKYPDLKATIFFRGIGQKQLLLKFARLKIINSSPE
jgi:DNA helicase-2/ATP-dependent DNA helicase PcrA